MTEEEDWQTWKPRRGIGFKIIVWVLLALGTTVALVLMVIE